MLETCRVGDVENVVEQFQMECRPEHRYASFDYCYNYFQGCSPDRLEEDIEKACLELAFYLASWGMLRGSSFLLQKSIKHYEPLIKYIIVLKRDNHNIWKIDVDSYTEGNMGSILEVYNEIAKVILGDGGNRHLVLSTKIMLGVFGCIPAFDEYFTRTFRGLCRNMHGRHGFRSVNMRNLEQIKFFYESNKSEIDNLGETIHTLDFETGEPTSRRYSKAKIIDMYGFSKSFIKKNDK